MRDMCRAACLPCSLFLQAGQEASQAAAPKSAGKGKKLSAAAAAVAALSDEARSAIALVEAVAEELPQLEKDK